MTDGLVEKNTEQLSKNEIYVYSPSNAVSGGINSLHILCRALRCKGFNARMYYTSLPDSFQNDPIIQSFNLPYCLELNDSPGNLLIVPEATTSLLQQFSQIRKMVYWLGLFFYFRSKPNRGVMAFKPLRRLFYCSDYFGKSRSWCHSFSKKLNYWNKKNDPIWRDGTLHMSNSYYVADFLKSMGIEQVWLLHNPVRDEFYSEKPIAKRSKTILFGPKTSQFLIKQLQKQLPGFRCIRLKGLAATEVKNLYNEAMLFIELGNFSGRDRMPREAVLSGCVVISSTNGSAAYYDDIQLPDFYKVNTRHTYQRELVDKVISVTGNYQKHFDEMKPYIKYLRHERDDFERNAAEIFKRMCRV